MVNKSGRSQRRQAGGALRIHDLATKATRVLETGSSYDTVPNWSPRGDWIAFTSKRDGDYEIYRIKPDGTQLQRLTRLPGPDAHPSFSPDGEWIAFASGARGFKDEAIGLVIGALTPQFQSYGEIAGMRADGSGLHMLTDDSIEQGTSLDRSARRAVGRQRLDNRGGVLNRKSVCVRTVSDTPWKPGQAP
jgi:TolB protein